MRASARDDLEYDKERERERDRDKDRKGRESCFDFISESGYHPSSCDREDY